MLDYITDPLFWILLVWVFLPGIICYYMAVKKRRSTFLWLLIGMILGWIGVLLIYFIPKLPPKKYNIEKTDRIDSKIKMYKELEEFQQAKHKKVDKNLNES